MCQDILVPIPEMTRVLQECADILKTWPVWICPHKTHRVGFLAKKEKEIEKKEMNEKSEKSEKKEKSEKSEKRQKKKEREMRQMKKESEMKKENMNDWDMFVDLGYYNTPLPVQQGIPFDALSATHQMEQLLLQVNGYQALYAVNTLTPSDFEKMFDLSLYRKMREQYGCQDVFIDVYDKIKMQKKE